MTHSMYAHIVVYALITVMIMGSVMGIIMMYHYINAKYFVPVLERMHQRMMDRRAMDSTRARYMQEGGK